jgi:hypothetical protein
LSFPASTDRTSESPFERYGLTENPFPANGLHGDVFYTNHIAGELARIQAWFNAVAAATDPARPAPQAVTPLAIYGSLGVGKTHLLNYLERGLRRNSLTPTLRKGLADEGMSRLVLADLILRYLPDPPEPRPGPPRPGGALVYELVKRARQDKRARGAMEGALRPGSPIATPLFAAAALDDDATTWFARWLRREYTTPAQRSKLGLAGVLQSEGEAIRAVADLMRLARVAGFLRAWFLLIDQLEELWRPNVVTATRRARFLTDLRHLIDECQEGAPVAVLLAWNTTVEHEALLAAPAVQDRMQQDYRALWQRLGAPLDLPTLRGEDVWPFARTYLDAAPVMPSRDVEWVAFRGRLEALTPDVRRERDREGPSGFAPRKVLAAWRARAEDVARSG